MTDQAHRAADADGSGANPRASAAFSQYLAAMRQRRRELTWFSCGAVALLFCFAYASYVTLSTNFSKARLRSSTERVGRELVSEASPMMIDVAKQVVPVYRAEAERAVHDLIPELTKRARAEFDLAAEHLSAKAKDTLRNTTTTPFHNTIDRLTAQFPCLQDQAFRDELLQDAETTLRAEMNNVLANAHATYQPQADRLIEAFRKLEREAPPAADTQELSKRFVHLWLLLIDTELMDGATSFDGKVGMGCAQNAELGG